MARSQTLVAGSTPVAVDEHLAAAAHLARRTSLAVDPERVHQLAALNHDDAVAAVLDHRGPDGPAPVSDDSFDSVTWWIERMGRSDAGLTDRMAWFWHGLLTTSAGKVSDSRLIAEQVDRFRTDGRSDLRTILHGFVTGGALLEYLDASWSVASHPNENLARELMELFTIGRGNYSEDDVRAAARALAGWVVEDGRVEFRRENAFIAPLLFLGDQADWDTAGIVDRLCDHPATAVRVATRLWEDLVGTTPGPDRAAELGAWWSERDLAVDPLLERILSDDAFVAGRLSRPRTGLEWFCATRSALDRADQPLGDELWRLEDLGQLPYAPPNVAGWPRDHRWLAAGSLLHRAAVAQDVTSDHVGDTGSSVDEILDRCSLHEISPATRAGLDRVGRGSDEDPASIAVVRWRLALTCPEFNLS